MKRILIKKETVTSCQRFFQMRYPAWTLKDGMLSAMGKRWEQRKAFPPPIPVPAEKSDPVDYFCGLDLGQTQDYTALVALERREMAEASPSGRRRYKYEVRGCRRWPLHTAYTQIAEDVAGLVSKPPLAGCVLGVDKTGVGAGVLEIIKAARPDAMIRPVWITAGAEVTYEHGTFRVPKTELVGAVTAILESGRLAIPPINAEAVTLGKELKAFRAKVTASGHEQLEADWRSRQHDDLCLALAIAAFLSERRRRGWIRINGESMDL
jgi:hypothetical protein